MESRKDDRDAKKSVDQATDNPWEANKDGADQQAAELQTDDGGERANPDRFAPDPASEPQQSTAASSESHKVAKDEVNEP